MSAGKSVAVLIKDRDRHSEGVRFSLGLLLERHEVTLVMLGQPLNLTEDEFDNLGFIDEMGGARLSDHPGNVARHGFVQTSVEQLARSLDRYDLVVPF